MNGRFLIACLLALVSAAGPLGRAEARARAANLAPRTRCPAAASIVSTSAGQGFNATDAGQERAQTEALPAGELKNAIDRLSSVDYAVRTAAARKIRRVPAAQAVPALLEATREHKDGYVRFSALVLLTGFNDPRTREVMLAMLSDPNDRLREVACQWAEHNPDPQLVDPLLAALGRDSAEFVRPALLRALAAHGSDAKVRAALLPEIARGQTMFRSALIEALGDYRAAYALAPLLDTVQLEGPLQVDAAIALGRIGDKRALNSLVAAQRTAPREAQPQIAAAICLLGVNCPVHVDYIDKTLRFAVKNSGFQPLLRNAAAAAGALAQADHADAAALLFDVGIPSEDPARAPIALALGAVALRNTPFMLAVLEKRVDREPAVLVLRDAFDMLEEPYEKERFFVAVRRAYWQTAEGSQARKVAQMLIEKLEF